MKESTTNNGQRAVKVLNAKTMKSRKQLLSMAGRSGRNQSGCCG